MRRRVRHFIAVSIAALVFMLNGCTLNPSKASVLGAYDLRGIKAGRITLTLRGDGTYSEVIRWPSQREDRENGNWTLSGGDVNLSGLWIPREFAPDYIVEADERSSAPRMPKFTEPGNWSLSAEMRWGVVFLTVFPDADIEFKKVSVA
jgi:hypothetical protein